MRLEGGCIRCIPGQVISRVRTLIESRTKSLALSSAKELRRLSRNFLMKSVMSREVSDGLSKRVSITERRARSSSPSIYPQAGDTELLSIRHSIISH